jgi:hypothetical protein
MRLSDRGRIGLCDFQLEGTLPGGSGPGFTCSARSNAVEPITEQVPGSQRACLASKHEESSLKGVFRSVRVAQHTSTDSKDHRTMPFDQRFKCQLGGFVVSDNELLEKL